MTFRIPTLGLIHDSQNTDQIICKELELTKSSAWRSIYKSGRSPVRGSGWPIEISRLYATSVCNISLLYSRGKTFDCLRILFKLIVSYSRSMHVSCAIAIVSSCFVCLFYFSKRHHDFNRW